MKPLIAVTCLCGVLGHCPPSWLPVRAASLQVSNRGREDAVAAAKARQLAGAWKWAEAEAAFKQLEAAGRLTLSDLGRAVEVSQRLRHWGRVIEIYTRFGKKHPLPGDHRLKLYEAYLHAGDRSSAERELLLVIAERPNQERLIHLLAFLSLEQGRSVKAAEIYRGFLAHHPDAYESRINLALILFTQKRTQAALEQLRQAFRAGLSEANRYLYRQLVRNMSRLSPQEIAVLARDTRAEVGQKPDGIEAYLYLAEEYKNLNRYDQAIFCYEKYLEVNSQNESARFELARLYFLKGHDKESQQILQPLLEINDELSQRARLFAAELAVRAGNFEEAERRLSSLPESFSASMSFAYLSARVALHRGEMDKARQLLEEVTRKDPQMIEAFLHLGRLYMRLGRREEGRRVLTEFQRRKRNRDTP